MMIPLARASVKERSHPEWVTILTVCMGPPFGGMIQIPYNNKTLLKNYPILFYPKYMEIAR
jgi:hypothetical protein